MLISSLMSHRIGGRNARSWVFTRTVESNHKRNGYLSTDSESQALSLANVLLVVMFSPIWPLGWYH